MSEESQSIYINLNLYIILSSSSKTFRSNHKNICMCIYTVYDDKRLNLHLN